MFDESIDWDNSEGGTHPTVACKLDKQVRNNRDIVNETTFKRVLPKRYRRVYNRKRKTVTESFHAVAYQVDNSDAGIMVELNADLDRNS